MREFARSPEWACLRRHLEALRDDTLAQEDVQPPSATAEVMHYRAARQAFAHALRLPEMIPALAAQHEAAHTTNQARQRHQRGRR